MKTAVACACLLMASVAFAQTPPKPVPKPTLTQAEALTLQNYELLAENLTLKMRALQTEQAKLQAEIQSFVKGLEKPGYRLERNAQGQFVYVAIPPPKAEDKKK